MAETRQTTKFAHFENHDNFISLFASIFFDRSRALKKIFSHLNYKLYMI